MKSTNANTPRTQEVIAKFGKSVLHPLCWRALDFWELDKELSELTKQVLQAKKAIDTLKQLRRRATTLIDWFYDNDRQKDCKEAYQIVRKIDNDLLPTTEKGYLVFGKIWTTYNLWKTTAYALFEIERATFKRDDKAQKALQRIRKRWEAQVNRVPVKDSDARVLGIIELLRRKVFEAIRAKDGVVTQT